MTQAPLCREWTLPLDRRAGMSNRVHIGIIRGTGPCATDGNRRLIKLERDMDRMEEILDQVEERLNSLGIHFDADLTDLGYIRVAVMNPDPALKGREEEITVLD